jgi:hypothetical protein
MLDTTSNKIISKRNYTIEMFETLCQGHMIKLRFTIIHEQGAQGRGMRRGGQASRMAKDNTQISGDNKADNSRELT